MKHNWLNQNKVWSQFYNFIRIALDVINEAINSKYSMMNAAWISDFGRNSFF